MAQYKVPQDVEAEDKLLGPFTPRQVIYLFIALGTVGLSVGLINLFSEIGIIISIPLFIIAIFFLILALPLKKDQPTETYLIALINFHFLKPQKRFWIPGQRESTIFITAPKKVVGPRVRTIAEDEASRRLSFLANIVDTEGYSIKTPSAVQPEYVAEAVNTPDIYSAPTNSAIGARLSTASASAHDAAVEKMRAALSYSDIKSTTSPTIHQGFSAPAPASSSIFTSKLPDPSFDIPAPTAPSPEKTAALEELSKNPDYSVATIAKEANRINNSNDNEIYISLH